MGADGTGGRLVAGSENGTLTVYNPVEIMNSGAEAVVGQSDKHTGPVRALDFNPFQVNLPQSYTAVLLFPDSMKHIINLMDFFLPQNNLLASGANDSEIYIWDLNNLTSPMTPGAKSQVCEWWDHRFDEDHICRKEWVNFFILILPHLFWKEKPQFPRERAVCVPL